MFYDETSGYITCVLKCWLGVGWALEAIVWVAFGQRPSAVFGGEEGGGSGNTPQRYGPNLELGRCLLSFNLHDVKTISEALCCLDVTRKFTM